MSLMWRPNSSSPARLTTLIVMTGLVPVIHVSPLYDRRRGCPGQGGGWTLGGGEDHPLLEPPPGMTENARERSVGRVKTRDAWGPPKPKEFGSTAVIGRSFALKGTKSK